MSTVYELLSGTTILSASLLVHGVASVSVVGLLRDLLDFVSVLLLLAGGGVVAVGLVHRVPRAHDVDADPTSRARIDATGAVLAVGVGCTVGAMYGGALPIALGTAIGAAAGLAVAFRMTQRAHRSRSGLAA
jgi:hypothetical protein